MLIVGHTCTSTLSLAKYKYDLPAAFKPYLTRSQKPLLDDFVVPMNSQAASLTPSCKETISAPINVVHATLMPPY